MGTYPIQNQIQSHKIDFTLILFYLLFFFKPLFPVLILEYSSTVHPHELLLISWSVVSGQGKHWNVHFWGTPRTRLSRLLYLFLGTFVLPYKNSYNLSTGKQVALLYILWLIHVELFDVPLPFKCLESVSFSLCWSWPYYFWGYSVLRSSDLICLAIRWVDREKDSFIIQWTKPLWACNYIAKWLKCLLTIGLAFTQLVRQDGRPVTWQHRNRTAGKILSPDFSFHPLHLTVNCYSGMKDNTNQVCILYLSTTYHLTVGSQPIRN